MDDFVFGNTALKPYLDDYVHSQAVLQTVTNPSGALLPNGGGLGEPKFNADGSRFNGNWGRPQRDGPPLRAIAMIAYSNWLIAHGELERVNTTIWPIIANDLSYVGQYWYVVCPLSCQEALDANVLGPGTQLASTSGRKFLARAFSQHTLSIAPL